MTLILNHADWKELRQQAPKPPFGSQTLDDFEEVIGVPKPLGHGYVHNMELLPGVWLSFTDWEFSQDWMLKVPDHDHPIQMMIYLSGFSYCDIYPVFGETCSYFSGSGISPAYVETHRQGERATYVNVEIEPELLDSFLTDEQRHSDTLKLLLKGEDWKVSFYPIVTSEMRSLAQQLWNAPYRGAAKRMYFQAKVFELLALHLDLISFDQDQALSSPKLRPDTIARLHYAKEILSTQLKNPPLLSDLAKQVGVSDRTLQRGFRELFGTTVFKYLHNLRMEQAAQLLRSQEMQVSEVAYAVGYSHLGHFTEAFKRKFRMTPKQCQKGDVIALS